MYRFKEGVIIFGYLLLMLKYDLLLLEAGMRQLLTRKLILVICLVNAE